MSAWFSSRDKARVFRALEILHFFGFLQGHAWRSLDSIFIYEESVLGADFYTHGEMIECYCFSFDAGDEDKRGGGDLRRNLLREFDV